MSRWAQSACRTPEKHRAAERPSATGPEFVSHSRAHDCGVEHEENEWRGGWDGFCPQDPELLTLRNFCHVNLVVDSLEGVVGEATK